MTAALTPQDKYDRKAQRMLEKLNTMQLGTAKNFVAKDFQKMVRLESIEADGLVSCVTCSWRGSHKQCDGGHFVSRDFNATVFNLWNCHVQCKNCNGHLHGNLSVYRPFMVERYGESTVKALESLKKSDKRFTREELVELRMGFRQRIAELEEFLRLE